MQPIRFANSLGTAGRRSLSITPRLRIAPFPTSPSPPRLPEEEQQRYEELQKSSTGAFSTPRPTALINQSPASASSDCRTGSSEGDDGKPTLNARVDATGDGKELHPDIRRGAKPEFETERNPKTGEVGGPKNDPLLWQSEWTYNGRATDF